MRYSFGKYAIEPDLHELRADGEVVPVEPQVFALLLYLVENRSRVVSKDELIEAIWDGRFVSDSAISSRIKSARQAIGDSGKDQASIRTIHGRGFRFVAEVTEDEPAPERPPTRDSGLPGDNPLAASALRYLRRHRAPYLLAAGAAVAAGAVVVVTVLLLQAAPRTAPHARFAILPVQNATGEAELKWTELGLMSLIQYSLDQEAGVDSISPGTVLSLAEGGERPIEGPLALDDALIDKFSGAHHATHIVLSRLTGGPGERRLEYVVFADSVRGDEKFLIGKDPTLLAGDMARDLVSLASGRRGLTFVDRTVSDDPFVLEAYARGRALQLEGRAKESRALFSVAISQEPENLWLRYENALSTRMMGDYKQAKTLLAELLDEAVENGDLEAELAIVNALGITEMRLSDLESAVVHSERAVVLAEELQEHEKLGTTLINLGIQYRILKKYELAEAALNRAITAYADTGLPPPVALLNSLALLKWDMKDMASAETYLTEALEGVAATGDKRSEGAILKNLAELDEVQGRWDRAEERYRQSLLVRRQTDDTYGIASSLSALGKLALKRGRPADARRSAGELFELFEMRGDSNDVAFAYSILGESDRLDGKVEESASRHEKALQIFAANDNAAGVQWEELYLAGLRPSGDGAAHATISRIAEWAQANDEAELQLKAHLLLAQREDARGDYAEAESHLSSALAVARAIPSVAYEGVVAARLGINSLKRGDEAAAATYYGLANTTCADCYEALFLAARREALAMRMDRAAEFVRKAREKAGANWPQEYEAFLNEVSTLSK